MLKSEHAIANFDYTRRRVHPDRLRHGRDDQYLKAARLMLRVYSQGVGQPRQTLHRRIEQVLNWLDDCPPRRVAAFCKLLDQIAQYNTDRKRAKAMRQRVFTAAAPLHPIVSTAEGFFDHTLSSARQQISEEIGMSWPQIEACLFADVIELQTLRRFDCSLDPRDLLSLYNVSQTQAALYRATRMRIDATDDFKTILRHAKLAGLMHRITRIERGTRVDYRFEFDGPQSSLRSTWRYGIRYAQMLPKLLSCRGWQMTAWIIGPDKRPFVLRVSPADALRTPLASPDEFDSRMESQVYETWQRSPPEGWEMQREAEVLHCGQSILTPDFVLRHHETGRLIYLEVVGYWTPEYLNEKCERLRKFTSRLATAEDDDRHWLLLFPKGSSAAQSLRLNELPIPWLIYEARSDPQTWITAALTAGGCAN